MIRQSVAKNSFSNIELANYYGTSPATIYKIQNNGRHDDLDEDKICASATSTTEPYITLNDGDNDNDEGYPADHTAAQSVIKSEVVVDDAVADGPFPIERGFNDYGMYNYLRSSVLKLTVS